MRNLLLDAIEEAFDRKSWHGTNLRGSLRSITAEQALWRPGSGRHNIWEIAVHCAYWKYAVRRRLTQEDRGSFPLKGSNWFPRDAGDERAWAADLKMLGNEHKLLRAAVAGVDPMVRDKNPPGGKLPYAHLIRGAAAHDLYHAGQIQLLKRLRSGG